MFYLWCSSRYLLGFVVARIVSVLWSCVSFISNSGSALWLLFRMSFMMGGSGTDLCIGMWEEENWLLYQWRVEMKPGYMARLQIWKFFLHIYVKEASVSTLLLHSQCWVSCVTWSALCESLIPLQTVLWGKNSSCMWGSIMRNIKMLNKMIPGHWISKWQTRDYNVKPHNKHLFFPQVKCLTRLSLLAFISSLLSFAPHSGHWREFLQTSRITLNKWREV